jgi:hypothetical protein
MQSSEGKAQPHSIRSLIEKAEFKTPADLQRLMGDLFLVVLPPEASVIGTGLTHTRLDDTMDLNDADPLEETRVFSLGVGGGALVTFSVGRLPRCDVTLDDGSVSSAHAAIKIGPLGEVYLQDTNSTNGTFLDDAPVPREGQGPAFPVKVGNSIRFGNVRTVLLDSEALHRLLSDQS